MSDILRPDVCIIGAGSGGLSVAAGAAQLGAETVLIESGKMGGDCLNYGCVPSKSLIAAASAANTVRNSGRFGVVSQPLSIDMAAVRGHVRQVIRSIEPHDSVERFEGLGVKVIKGEARFRTEDEVEVGDQRIRARRFVVATGSRPSTPPIAGLDSVDYFTNETIFDNDQHLPHLVVIGAGPIGCELAQAYRRLGSVVTLVDLGPILVRDDPDLSDVVRQRMIGEGIRIHEHVDVVAVKAPASVTIRIAGSKSIVEGSHLLIATGRQPNIEKLELDRGNINHDRGGIKVDSGLRTSNRRVYAIGDVAGGPQLTHVAGYHAGIVIKNALFRLPAKANHTAVPWVTYTDPELAQVGHSEAQARAAGHEVEIVRSQFAENDRARAEAATEGEIKLVLTPKGRVLGAGIVGLHAGELILPWVLAVEKKLKLSTMAATIAPYPTLAEISKRAAGSYFTPKLFNDRTRKIVRWLSRFG